MITRIEARNFKCLKYVDVRLRPFQVLVGPNGSGKSSLFEALLFLSRCMQSGLEPAVIEQSTNPFDLTWGRAETSFSLAVELTIPEPHRYRSVPPVDDSIRYEVEVSFDASGGGLRISHEQIYLWPSSVAQLAKRAQGKCLHDLHAPEHARDGIVSESRRGVWSILPQRTEGAAGVGEVAGMLETRRSSLRSVLDALDERQFPSPVWLREFLASHLARVRLEGPALRKPSHAAAGRGWQPTGAGLPWLVEFMQHEQPRAFEDWQRHVAFSLEDISGVRVIERPEDRSKYLMLRCGEKLEVPSWMASEGTLRFLALTFLAYSDRAPRVCLIEEPEDALHPTRIELALQVLRSAWDQQILISTHSPGIVTMCKREDLLIFARDAGMGTRVLRGTEHPGLEHWEGSPSLGTLLASGALG